MNKYLKIIFVSMLITLFWTVNYSLGFGPSSDKIYKGIDISQWQEEVDFRKVRRDGIEVVYIKSSQGNDFIDPYFERNYKNAKDNNLKIGVYHFLTARNRNEAIDQADFFSSVISNKRIDCRLAMDFEEFGSLNKREINEISKAFLERVEKKTKKEMIIYSDASNARNIFDDELAKKYPIWVAEYGAREPANNRKWKVWYGFQYEDDGRVNGIRGKVDGDYYTKDIFLENNSKIKKIKHRNNKDKIRKIKLKRGDTLSKLAIKYKTTVKEIMKLNNIRNRHRIYVGEILKVPYSKYDSKGETGHKIYKVKRGDNLYKIARRFKISIKVILRLNDIKNPNLIYAGESLRIKS